MYIDQHAFVQPEQARHPIPRYNIKLIEYLFQFINHFLQIRENSHYDIK